MRVRDVMTRDVFSVRPDNTLKQAAAVMATQGFTALPVVEDGRLVGVLSEADVVADRYAASERAPATSVAEAMTTTVSTVASGADVAAAARTMLTERHRLIPVVDGDRLVGVVSRRDLVASLTRSDAAIAVDVRRNLAVLGGPDRWSVEVDRGSVIVRDAFDDPADRDVAKLLAGAVRGVVDATVFGGSP